MNIYRNRVIGRGRTKNFVAVLSATALALGNLVLQAPASSASVSPGTLLQAFTDATPNTNSQLNQGDQVLVGLDGSRFLVGNFTGTHQFAAGNITANGVNNGNMYIEKFDAQGSPAWVITFVPDVASGNWVYSGSGSTAAIAPDGSINVVGSYKGLMNVTLYQANGAGSTTSVSGGSKGMGFYASYNGATGAERFMQTIGFTSGSQGSANGQVQIQSIVVAGNGQGYIGGSYSEPNGSTPGTLTLGNTNAQTYTTSGNQDAFVASFNAATGELGWSAGAHGMGSEYAIVNSLAVNSTSGQLDVAYQGGHQSLTVYGATQTSGSDYTSSNPTGGGHSVLAQYATSNGNLNWAHQIASDASDTVLEKILVSSNGTIYGAGTGSYVTTFEGSTLSLSYTHANDQSPYLVIYSSSGDALHLWGSDFAQGLYDYYRFPSQGGWLNLPVGLAIDSGSNAYITFPFKDAGTFNGSTVTPNNANYKNIFVGKFNADFTQDWVTQINPSGNLSFPGSLAFDTVTNSLLISGSFSGTMTFGSSTLTSAHTNYQAFYGEIAESAPPAPPASSDASATFTVDGTAHVANDTITVASGTTSVAVVVTPNEGHATYTVSGDTGLQTGNNTVTVLVTAEDGTTSVTTHFNVVVSDAQQQSPQPPVVVVIPDIPQKSNVIGTSLASIPAGKAIDLGINGSFAEKVVGVRVNGKSLPDGSWSQTATTLTISLPALEAGTATIQIFNGSVPVLNVQELVISSTPAPATTKRARRHEIVCAKEGKGDRVLFDVNPTCPVGYTQK